LAVRDALAVGTAVFLRVLERGAVEGTTRSTCRGRPAIQSRNRLFLVAPKFSRRPKYSHA